MTSIADRGVTGQHDGGQGVDPAEEEIAETSASGSPRDSASGAPLTPGCPLCHATFSRAEDWHEHQAGGLRACAGVVGRRALAAIHTPSGSGAFVERDWGQA